MVAQEKLFATVILYISTIVNIKSIIYNSFEVDCMISYEPFYKTIKEKGISTYKLINQYGISRSLIDRLKHNKPISTVTLNDLCTILQCTVQDVLVFIPDGE